MKKTKQKLQKQHSLITEPYDGIVEKMKTRRPDLPDYYYQLNAEEKEMNQMIIDSMNMKVNYLKNPRFRHGNTPILYADVN